MHFHFLPAQLAVMNAGSIKHDCHVLLFYNTPSCFLWHNNIFKHIKIGQTARTICDMDGHTGGEAFQISSNWQVSYSPEAFIYYVLLLGLSPNDNESISHRCTMPMEFLGELLIPLVISFKVKCQEGIVVPTAAFVKRHNQKCLKMRRGTVQSTMSHKKGAACLWLFSHKFMCRPQILTKEICKVE